MTVNLKEVKHAKIHQCCGIDVMKDTVVMVNFAIKDQKMLAIPRVYITLKIKMFGFQVDYRDLGIIFSSE